MEAGILEQRDHHKASPRTKDMSTNKQILQEAFAGTARGDGRAFVGMLADEVRWHIIGTTDWSETYEGKDSVINDLLRPLADNFAGSNIVEATRFVGEGDTIAVEGRNLSVTKRGPAYPNRYCWIFRMAAGRVVEVTEYCDTALIERVLVRPPREA
jgi:ketosteroid isomerase-like protein